jgi:predicted RNA-binding protein with TRAM domain
MYSHIKVLKVGQIISLQITGIGHGGDPYGRLKLDKHNEGVIVFVRGVKRFGIEPIKVKITAVAPKCVYAEPVDGV